MFEFKMAMRGPAWSSSSACALSLLLPEVSAYTIEVGTSSQMEVELDPKVKIHTGCAEGLSC